MTNENALHDGLIDEPRVRQGGNSGIAAGQIRSFVEPIEHLEEEKAAIAQGIKEVYGEARANGFDTRILRRVITLRKKDAAEREEEEAVLQHRVEKVVSLRGGPPCVVGVVCS
jgi:uncharacterized protein (UPF0335 family)